MNSESIIENLTGLILSNVSVQVIVDQSTVIHSIYSKEKLTSEFKLRTVCIGKSLPECMNLDLARQIVKVFDNVQKNSNPEQFKINIATKTGLSIIKTEIVRLPADYFFISFEQQEKMDLGSSDSLEKQIISDIIREEKIDQVIRIILDGFSEFFEVLGGGIYIYQYFLGDVSHQAISEKFKNLIEEIHVNIKDSSYWASICNGHTIFLPVEELNQLVEIDTNFRDLHSLLILPIHSDNLLLGIIILATKFTNYAEVEKDSRKNYVSWFVQVITSAIKFRKLRSESSTYLNILNESQDYYFVISPQGKIIFGNTSFQEKTQYNHFEISKIHLSDIVPGLKDEIDVLIKSGTEINHEWHPLVYVDKYNNQFSLVTKLIFRDDGLIVAIAQKDRDDFPSLDIISEKGNSIAGRLSQPILLIDESTLNIRYANLFAHQYYGFGEGELINKNFLELISEEDHQYLLSSIREKGFFGFNDDRIWEQKTKSKSKIQSRFVTTTINYEGKKSILLVVQEIEQEKIPTLIKDVSDFYNLLNQDLVIVRLSPKGIITHANERFSELIGKPQEKLIGKSFEENLFMEDYEPIFSHFGKLTPNVPIRKNKNRIVGANGRTIWMEWTDRGIFDGEELLEIYAIGKDITHEMKLDLIDQSSEQRYQALVETLPLVIYVFHIETHFPLYVSPQIKTIIGYNAEEFYKAPDFLTSIMHPDDANDFYNIRMERIERNTNQPIEFRVFHADGRIRWLEEIGSTITLADGTRIFQGAVRDITESHEIKEKLEYYSKLRGMLNDASLKLLRANHENYSEIIQKTIGTIGKTLQVDRVIVFEKDKSDQSSSNTYEWCNEGIASQKQNLQSVSHSSYPWWRKKMENNHEIIMNSVDDLPIEANAERENIISQDIKSLMSMPLYSRGKIFGWIGFDMVRTEIHWDREEINLLRLLSALIVNTHERIFLL